LLQQHDQSRIDAFELPRQGFGTRTHAAKLWRT
jgi:hypothetical protein